MRNLLIFIMEDTLKIREREWGDVAQRIGGIVPTADKILKLFNKSNCFCCEHGEIEETDVETVFKCPKMKILVPIAAAKRLKCDEFEHE